MPDLRTTTAFEVRIAAPATPERVAQAARMVANVFNAAGTPEDDHDPNITLEIYNKDLRALVHPRSPEGRRATKLFVQFLQNPMRLARTKPATRRFAAVLADSADTFAGEKVSIVRPRVREPLAVFDDEFARSMRSLAKVAPTIELRGSDEIISRIFRVGCTDEGRHIKARIVLDGRPQDVLLPEDLPENVRADFYEYAKTRALARIQLEVAWARDEHGLLSPFAPRCRVTGIEPCEETTGAQLLDEVAAAGPLFSASIEDMIAQIEGRDV
ncbi:MAG TPA: hypothetical protein PKE31_20965 [Pseudomonadota bacterium]|jgi:hypothetical protein|nr:hypothetical protein [Pseudomonadota bacterium]